MAREPKEDLPSTTSLRKDVLTKKALSLNWLTPEAKVVLLALIFFERTEDSVSIVELDEMCQMTLADVDIGAIFLHNTLDLPTMKKFGLTHRINVAVNPAYIQLSEDWRLTDGESDSTNTSPTA